ncbi:MAG: ABC transporter permease [Anaerolineae bacterium]|nr:ABC transporter permease [Anaerolineae bacterium]
MLNFFLRRFAFMLLTLLFTSLIIFTITNLLPGRVARVLLGREASEEALVALEHRLGLDQPAPVRYVNWLTGFARGDWGQLFQQQGREVRPLVMERLTKSLWLAGLALLFSVPLAILLGVVAGLQANKPIDGIISVTSLAVTGLPEFVTGVVLINVIAIQWKLFNLPSSSSISPRATFVQALPSLILPAVTATLVLLAYIVRLTRAGVIEVLKKPYVRTAVLKGLSWREVVFGHILRNALLPTITVVAISFGWLISGLVVIENVFNYPGLGRLMLDAVDSRDLPLMQAISMVTVAIYVFANFVADMLYAYVNPRIRLE